MRGFVALFRLLVVRIYESFCTCLDWICYNNYSSKYTHSSLAILQTVDGIALKFAIDVASAEEKMMAFRVAEGIIWTEIGTNSIYRILQGTVAIVFGIAITLSRIVGRWIDAIGIFAGAVTIAAGVAVAYVGFASVNVGLGAYSKIIYYICIGILGAFMWRKTMSKTVIV